MAVREKDSRAERWNFRVADEEDELVRAAAEASNLNLTVFVRRAAVVEAQRVLTDRRRFALNEEQWNQFNELLDRPPEVPPGLKKLFSKPSVFEE